MLVGVLYKQNVTQAGLVCDKYDDIYSFSEKKKIGVAEFRHLL